jgi:nucleotide-binding universal stress UspA family protein
MYKKILVPLDGSKESEQALPHVKTAATGHEPPARVFVFLAMEPSPPLEYVTAPTKTQMAEHVEQEEKKEASAKQYLGNLANGLREDGVDVEEVVVKMTSADVPGEILNYIEENGIELIIMSTHGRSGISRWAFGSVTARQSSRYRSVQNGTVMK